jgi:toxin ParE1/3/4
LAEIRFRARADADLVAIRKYSLSEFGREVATRYFDEFEVAWSLISDHPRIGSPFAASGKKQIRSIPCGSHRIYYWVSGQRIWIVRILHQSMDQSRIVKLIG